MEQTQVDRCADVVLRAGAMMLGAGTSALRVMELMQSVANALGLDSMQAQITYNDITLTVSSGTLYRTKIEEVPFPGVNSDHIAALKKLGRTLPEHTTADDVDARLNAIAVRPARYPRWLLALVAGIACSSITLLNGGDWHDVVAVIPASASAWWVHKQLTWRQVNRLACVLIAAFWAAGTFQLITHLLNFSTELTEDRLAVGLITATVFLIPGFPLVTGGLELTRLDLNAGIPRVVYAAMVLLTIAIGVWLVVGLSGTSPEPAPPWVMPMWLVWAIRLVASFLAVFSWALIFNSPPWAALMAGLIAMVGNVPRLLLIDAGVANHIATFLGAALMGLLCAAAARLLNEEKIIMTVPTLLVMIPGASALRTMLYFDAGEINSAIEYLLKTILVLIAMVAGLSAARMLTDPEWAFTRTEPPSLHRAAFSVTKRMATDASVKVAQTLFRRRR